MRNLYPEIEPFDTGMLKVSDIHNLYYEQSGNPEGKPIVYLHGGPGAGADSYVRRFFDPDPAMDITGLVADLPMPVLVMHGTADRQVPFAGSEYLAQQIANSQHYAFEGKGHVAVQTATKEFIAALGKFLSATD